MRQEMRHVIVNIQGELNARVEISPATRKHSIRFAEILDTPPPPETISAEVEKVINDTHAMEQAHHRLESNMMHNGRDREQCGRNWIKSKKSPD